jgi:O-antigen/teichoic acid export membrane protein
LRPFDTDGVFVTPADSGGLRRRAVRSAGITMVAQVASYALQIVATIVLARLLTPGDFGVVAMVTTFSMLLANVGQLGFPEAVLQREEMNDQLASNIFWINFGIGVVLTIAFAAAGSLLARFYNEPLVARVAVGSSFSIFLSSIAVMHLALLQRALRFFDVSVINILCRLVSVGLSIILALAGWGYWALVAGAVGASLAAAIAAFVACQWIPKLPRRKDGTGSSVRFASHVFGRFSIDYISHNMDNILVGWRFGPRSLGFYKKAYELFVLPANQFLSAFPVGVSTLSRLVKDLAQYKRYLLGGITILALVGMGLGAELTLVGQDVIHVLLGAKWLEAGRIFAYFGPGIGVMLIYRTHGMIHLSIGTTGRYLRWGLIEATVTILMFILALRWGPIGIAAAWTASSWILIVPAFSYAGKPIQFGVSSLLGAIWKYILSSLAAGIASFAIIRAIPYFAAAASPAQLLMRVTATTVLFGVLYIGGVILLHGGGKPIYEFIDILREMAPRRFSKPVPSVGANLASEARGAIDPTIAGGIT